MDSSLASSLPSCSFVPPRRPVLSACLLACWLVLSSPCPASAASQSLAPSPTPPPAFFTPPTNHNGPPSFGSMAIQPALVELDWPAEQDERSAVSSPEHVVDLVHPPPPARRQAGTNTSRRLNRQETTQSDEPINTATGADPSEDAQETASGVGVAENPSSIPSGGLVASPTSTTSAPATASTATAQPTTTVKTKVAPPVPTPNLPLRNPFPQPFDLTLNLNLSSTCLDFFSWFLSSPTFQACRPFSLLQSSSSAFSTLASADTLTAITGVIQASVNVDDPGQCEATMVGLGTTIRDRCKSDLAGGVPIVKEALTGFQTYALMHRASALVSSDTGAYCYVEALASDSPADLFLWNLYTGASLPNSTTPSCSSCTKSLLDLYASDADNGTLALSKSYDGAVEVSNAKCGEAWAQTVLVVQSSSARPSLSSFNALFLLGPLVLSFYSVVSLLS